MVRNVAAAIIAAIAVVAIVAMIHRPSHAALANGKIAPPFTTEATLAGNEFTFDLSEALKHGPVVLYFYPAAFTSGCTIEAHDFAEHIADFKSRGATLIGVSGDGIEKLKKFSLAASACQGKFAVASDPELTIAKAYHAVILNRYANRTSYVIAPAENEHGAHGKIVYEYTSLDPGKHVANTLSALDKLRASAKTP